MALHLFLNNIRESISKDELDSALRQLHALLKNSPKLNEVIQQMGRFAALQEQMRLGILTHENASVDKNKLRLALLDLVTEIEKEGVKPDLQQEIENAVSIVNSKNVATGTFKAGRDLRIGDNVTYVNHYGKLEIPRLLTPPPFLPEIFLGRTDDLQQIHDKLFAPGGNLLLLVNGEGGVGKTSIASKYFHTYQEEYAHVAWVFKEHSIADALLLLATPLGLKFDEQWDRTQRLDELLRSMLNLNKPCLLIIDNANELDDLQEHLPQLQRCSNFHVLFTTRITEYQNADFYKISPLPQSEALAAFKSHYKAFEPSEEALFFELYAAVQGNTLVLELLAKNLNNFNNQLKKRYLLADLKQDLEGGLLKLSKTSAVNTRYQAKGKGLRYESIEVIIMAMYDLGDLSAAENQLLSVFAVLPAESIPFERLETLLPELVDLDTHLLALAQKGWIEYNVETAAFKCSPVVQEVVRLKQVDLLENCKNLISSLCDQLDHKVLHLDNYQYSAAYVQYSESVLNSISDSNFDMVRLCQNIGKYYEDTGYLNKALSAHQKMQTIQIELLKNHPDNSDFKRGLAISHEKLGQTYSDLGNMQLALAYFENYNELEKELSETYPQNIEFKNGLAVSYSKLGEAHLDLGNLDKALDLFEQSNKLDLELYAAYPQNVEFKSGLSVSYSKLGQTHIHLGNLDKALTFIDQSIKLDLELYATYPQNVVLKNSLAVSYQHLGVIYRDLGDLKQALTFFERYNDLEKELFEAYPQNVKFKHELAVSYQQLGITNRDLGNLNQALTCFKNYNNLEKELFETYPQNVEFKNILALSYQWLGWFLEQKMENVVKAQECYRASKVLLEELIISFPDYPAFKKNLDWVNGKLKD